MIENIRLTVCKNHHFFSLFGYICLIIFLFSFKLEGQYRFDFENDSSGFHACCSGPGWMQYPEGRWCCDSMEPIEGGSSLHHCFDNPQEGCDYLVFRHDPLHVQEPFSFSFRVRHGYEPSSQNNWQLALGAECHDRDPLILSGIILGVNYSGSDDLVKLWQLKDGVAEVLCPTTLNYQEDVGTGEAPLFRVDGDGEGGLELYVALDPESEEPVLLGTCRVDELEWGRQLVLRYKYTSSRDRALWLDELLLDGHFEKDTVAPELRLMEFMDERSLQLGFTEGVRQPGAEAFCLSSDTFPEGLYPDSLFLIDRGVALRFPEVIPNRVPHRLRITGVLDFDGNLLRDTVADVMRNEARWGDLVFNEVMADPDPAVRYREEYLELLNRSDYLLDTEGWELRVNERTYILDGSMVEQATPEQAIPEQSSMEQASMDLMPGGFLVLNGITLPNEGAVLSLHSREGRQIHAVSYKVPWDGPRWKQEGGWSLESPDAGLVCRISDNWEFSTDPGGGTPGRINSNVSSLVDREPPLLLYAGLGDPGELFLHYSEPLRLDDIGAAAFRLDPGSGLPDWVHPGDALREVLHLHFPENFQEWTSYQLSVSQLSDCAGNGSGAHKLEAGAISQPVHGSVVINEIMYDPDENCPEFVELYLPGNRVLDLQDLAIHLAEEGGSPDRPVVLSPHSRLMLPGQYLVLTTSVPHLVEAYGLDMSGQWVEVEGLPGLHNSSGIIYLTDRAGNVVDAAPYSDDLHMELLDDPRGISLERVDVRRSGSDPDNWHSAASLVGYATPGRENSQSPGAGDPSGQADPDRRIEVEPQVFSPDNDGLNDLLQITISTGGNDWVVGVMITDLQGNIIKVLANNHLAGPSLTYTWDGEGETGSMQAMGYYVIHVRAYHPATGDSWIRRRAVGLVYR
jgi:hypothetical protein